MTALTLDPEQVASERQVILEEIAMYDSEPWDALEMAVPRPPLRRPRLRPPGARHPRGAAGDRRRGAARLPPPLLPARTTPSWWWPATSTTALSTPSSGRSAASPPAREPAPRLQPADRAPHRPRAARAPQGGGRAPAPGAPPAPHGAHPDHPALRLAATVLGRRPHQPPAAHPGRGGAGLRLGVGRPLRGDGRQHDDRRRRGGAGRRAGAGRGAGLRAARRAAQPVRRTPRSSSAAGRSPSPTGCSATRRSTSRRSRWCWRSPCSTSSTSTSTWSACSPPIPTACCEVGRSLSPSRARLGRRLVAARNRERPPPRSPTNGSPPGAGTPPAAGPGPRIHLNNAGAVLLPAAGARGRARPPPARAGDRRLRGGGRGGRAAARGLRRISAACSAARARNVAVVENATVAVAQALSAFDFAPGDVLVTTAQRLHLEPDHVRGARPAPRGRGAGRGRPSGGRRRSRLGAPAGRRIRAAGWSRSPGCPPTPAWCRTPRRWARSARPPASPI